MWMCSRNLLVAVVVAAAASCGTDATRNETPSSVGSGMRETYTAGSCAHDPCATGVKLSSSCNSCVGQICSADSYCCSNKWDQKCVNEVASVCGQSCSGGGGTGGSGGGGTGGSGGGGGGCSHPICSTGSKLVASCDPCATQVCAKDSYCCNTSWDSTCVKEVGSICGESCSGGGGSGGSGGGGSGGSGGGGGTGGSGGSGGGNLLKFAVFGDCRPPNQNGTNNYPSTIIGNIFSLAQSNGAQFTVGTGDYMFASTQAAVTAQVQLFNQAKSNYTAGPVYLTMGNHECNGFTDSNCPNLNETPNVQAFLGMLPSGVTKPYYRIDMNTPHGTAKFVFIAANAWDSTQSSWLSTQLAQPTTYTFVMRHESIQSSGIPAGVTASENIVKQHPYTLEMLGHTHEYSHVDTQHVISGNAGAPLQSGASFGLLIVEQQDNGNITVNEVDEASGSINDTWTVSPTGQPM
jgi:hypothetical protein